jgi:hypothetical protein
MSHTGAGENMCTGTGASRLLLCCSKSSELDQLLHELDQLLHQVRTGYFAMHLSSRHTIVQARLCARVNGASRHGKTGVSPRGHSGSWLRPRAACASSTRKPGLISRIRLSTDVIDAIPAPALSSTMGSSDSVSALNRRKDE